MKKVYVLGGGTVSHVRPHLALCAPAYGKTARQIFQTLLPNPPSTLRKDLTLGLTSMAWDSNGDGFLIGETNEQVEEWIQENIIENPEPSIVFLNVAFCDFNGSILKTEVHQAWTPTGFELMELPTPSGKSEPRLKSSNKYTMELTPSEKIVNKIRKERKDIFLVAFKTTSGATPDEQYEAGLNLLKKNSCNLVVANDIKTKRNVIIAPELAEYHEFIGDDRTKFLQKLVSMTLSRASNEFARTTVFPASPLVPWKKAPQSLVSVVEWCVENGAYKPFNDVTVGHFGYRLSPEEKPKPSEGTIRSSRRKQNFNRVECRDLVEVDFFEDGRQVAFGGKPSAGARSQYIVLSRHPYFDCIVHFHCQQKTSSIVRIRPQEPFECGSHQCGKNTADGIQFFENGQIGAVMLDKHGPNIIFNRNIDPKLVIKFIEENFDLSKSTR